MVIVDNLVDSVNSDQRKVSLRGPCGIVLYANKSPNPVEQMIVEAREFHFYSTGDETIP
jgi:hypothetical protein